MKIISYNVNGVRAAVGKGLCEWLKAEDPDIICLQETKAQPEQIPLQEFAKIGYHGYCHSAIKKGYSGVAILSKQEPDRVVIGMDMPLYDAEGRFIRADFGDLSVVSVYHPSGSSGELRQAFKMKWLDDFHQYVKNLEKQRPQLIISGDYNICHEAIDIHDPKGNADASGFLPEERAWMDHFLADGFIDSFRQLCKDPNHYSWWSFRANARANNKGWRIDYHMITKNLLPRLKNAAILPDAVHSDHCPIRVEISHQ